MFLLVVKKRTDVIDRYYYSIYRLRIYDVYTPNEKYQDKVTLDFHIVLIINITEVNSFDT